MEIQSSSKSRKILVLLFVLLGGWGAHRFYVGDKKGGIKFVLVSLIAFVLQYFVWEFNKSFIVSSMIGALGLIGTYMIISDLFKMITNNFIDSNGLKVDRW